MNKLLEENIVKSFNLDSMSPETQAKALEDIGGIIYERILTRVIDALDEQGQDEFDKLLGEKSGDGEKIVSFLKSKIPDFEMLVNDEIAKFKSEGLAFMKSAAE